jgi:hypothetical protein
VIEIRTDADAEPAHPDGPHDHEQTRAIASGIDDAVRLLNYATMSRYGLRYPSDVYSVLGELSGAISKLPQALRQMSQFIGAEVAEGRARENADYGRHGGDAQAAAGALAAAVREGSVLATDLSRVLDRAQAVVRGLESTRDEDQDDE